MKYAYSNLKPIDVFDKFSKSKCFFLHVHIRLESVMKASDFPEVALVAMGINLIQNDFH